MASFQLKQTGAQVQKAIDDATKVVANPSTTASAGLNKITIGETTYSVQGGGTYVEANPEGEATDTLNKVTIGETIYAVEGGSATAGIKRIIYREEQGESGTTYHFIDAETEEEITSEEYYELLETQIVGIAFDNLLLSTIEESLPPLNVKFSSVDFITHLPSYEFSEFRGLADVETIVRYEPGEDADIPIWQSIGTVEILFEPHEDTYDILLDYSQLVNFYYSLTENNNSFSNFQLRSPSDTNIMFSQDSYGQVLSYSVVMFLLMVDRYGIFPKLMIGSTRITDTCDFIKFEVDEENSQVLLIYKSTTSNKKYTIHLNLDFETTSMFYNSTEVTEDSGVSEYPCVLVNNNDTWEIEDPQGETINLEDFMNVVESVFIGNGAIDLIYDPDGTRTNCHYKFDKYTVQDLIETFTLIFINSKKQLLLTINEENPEITNVQVTDRFSGGGEGKNNYQLYVKHYDDYYTIEDVDGNILNFNQLQDIINDVDNNAVTAYFWYEDTVTGDGFDYAFKWDISATLTTGLDVFHLVGNTGNTTVKYMDIHIGINPQTGDAYIASVVFTDAPSGGGMEYIDTDVKVSLFINGADLPHYFQPEQTEW